MEIIATIATIMVLCGLFVWIAQDIRKAYLGMDGIIHDDRPAIVMAWRLEPRPEPPITTDEALDYLGNRFVDGRIRELTGITFGQYLGAPDLYDAQAHALENGDGLNTVAGIARIVPLKGAEYAHNVEL